MRQLPQQKISFLEILGLFLISLGIMVLAFYLQQARQQNRELRGSLQLLELSVEEERKHHLRRYDSLQQNISRQEEEQQLLKQELAALGKAGAEINKKAHEEKIAILRIRAVDSLWHEIARHYRP